MSEKKVLYHGTEKNFSVFNEDSFFSTSVDFSKDYGDVKKYNVVLEKNKIFDSSLKSDVENLLSKVALYDRYNDETVEDWEQYEKSSNFLSDTWEVIEDEYQVLKQDYDAIRIFEGGVENYLIFDPNNHIEKDNELKGKTIRECFEKSRVVDDKGKPVVFYHGTTKDFDKFEKEMIGSSTDYGIRGKGFYFTDNLLTAEAYAGDDGHVKSVYLDLKNPIDLLSFQNKEVLAEHLEIDSTILNERTTILPSGENRSVSVKKDFLGLFTANIKEKGYDGIIHGTEFIAFEPSQIMIIDNIKIDEDIVSQEVGELKESNYKGDGMSNNIEKAYEICNELNIKCEIGVSTMAGVLIISHEEYQKEKDESLKDSMIFLYDEKKQPIDIEYLIASNEISEISTSLNEDGSEIVEQSAGMKIN